MAFKSEEFRQQARELFLKGKTRKEVLAVIGDGATPGDLNNLAFTMRQAGELKPVTTGQGKKKDTQQKKREKKSNDKKVIRDAFDAAVESELSRTASEIERLTKLAQAYDKTMPEFAEKIESKMMVEEKRFKALKEYQNN